jgi:hypothetical protein
MRRSSMALPIASLLAMSIAGVEAQEPPAETASRSVPFELPCERYLQGLRGEGNFGVLITGKDSAFAGSHHLAEDVWLPAGTEVRSVADGIVRYSDFSPTWTDERGQVHWNLGNVIVIEHPLEAESDLDRVCSLSAHLAADRCVETGDRVQRGQVIGHIGKDRSEENGRYPRTCTSGCTAAHTSRFPPRGDTSSRRPRAPRVWSWGPKRRCAARSRSDCWTRRACWCEPGMTTQRASSSRS